MDEDYRVRLFIETDDGLMDYTDTDLSRIGGFLPQIGDEIADFDRWIGSATEHGMNHLLLVKRRLFIRDSWVVLVCEKRKCAAADYEFF